MAFTDQKKLDQIEYLLYLMAEKNYRNGFPYYNQNYRKRRKLFKPLFANTLFVFYVLKSILSLIISDDFYSLLIGDFVCVLDIKIQFNLMLINFQIMTLLFVFLNYITDKNDPNFRTTHTTGNNRNESFYLKMSSQFKYYERIVTSYLSFLIFLIALLFSYISYPKTLIWMIIGMYWSIALTLAYVVSVEVYYWNLLYFLSFCYYSRLSLKALNQRLRQIVEKQKFVSNYETFTSCLRINLIYKKIMAFNEFWSKICIVYWFGLGTFLAISLYQIVFGGLANIYIQFVYTLIIISIIVLGFFTPIIIFCSSVVLEAKNTYKLLNRLNARNGVIISLRFRIKV